MEGAEKKKNRRRKEKNIVFITYLLLVLQNSQILLFLLTSYMLMIQEVQNKLHQTRYYRTVSNSFWHRVGRCLVKLVPSF